MRIGILGAGQLGRMLALAAHPLGIRCVAVSPRGPTPSDGICDVVFADYHSDQAAHALAECDVVTYEFENVPLKAAEKLQNTVQVSPNPQALEVAQDRLEEKRIFVELGIPTPPFAAASSQEELETAIAKLGTPCIVKTRRLGYDGKGQRRVLQLNDAEGLYQELGNVPLLVETLVSFDAEVSVLGVRAASGQEVFYPLTQNTHRQSILVESRVPTEYEDLTKTAQTHSRKLMRKLGYVGVLALEFFVAKNKLLANEIAPRVHNSGHWTIEGAPSSQFENHLRAIAGLPLGNTQAKRPTAMLNLLGQTPTSDKLLGIDEVHLHLYGKTPRPGRKIGHVTVLADTQSELDERLSILRRVINSNAPA